MLGYSLSLAHDRDVGVLQRLRVTPVPTWLVMGSRLCVQVVTNLIASLVVLIVGALLHGLHLAVAQYALVLAVAALGAAVFLSIGQAIVGLINSVTAVNAIGRVVFIVLLLLGLLGVTGILGDVVKAIGDWSPVGALMRLFTAALTGSPWAADDGWALLACAGYITVFAFAGIRWFRWESR